MRAPHDPRGAEMIYAVLNEDGNGYTFYRGEGLWYLGDADIDEESGEVNGYFDTHYVYWHNEMAMADCFARWAQTNDEDRLQLCNAYAEAWAADAWQGEGWYVSGWSDGGQEPEPEWCEDIEQLEGCIDYLLHGQTEHHQGWIEYAGDGDEPEGR